MCSFLKKTRLKQWSRCYWAMGFNVKTVLVILFEGFPNRFSLVGFTPPVSYGHVYMCEMYTELDIETF